MTEQEKYALYIQTTNYFNLCKPEAYKYAKEGYDNGSVLCGFFLAWCLFHGLGCEKDLQESYNVFQVIRPVVRKEARGRNPQYSFIESLYYSYGLGGMKVDRERGFEKLTFSAMDSFGPALYVLGLHFLEAVDTKTDLEEAFICMEKAYKKGNVPPADYKYAHMLLNGMGCKRDSKKAFSVLKDLTNKGYILAYQDLAICYEKGYGVNQDIEKANECKKIIDESDRRIISMCDSVKGIFKSF